MLGGKGGVGKTSSAASLGVRLGSEAGPTLVVSTDPAHSLSDSLDQVFTHTSTLTCPLPVVMAFKKINMLVIAMACVLGGSTSPPSLLLSGHSTLDPLTAQGLLTTCDTYNAT